ncbi:hypothetical protein RYX56_17190 [Alkalihalophilus lindianensis]|uniref:Bla regulator protein blaR1 n=1 Tax=Alkalihalophilus lindianensis TaxID=1630542 RepID=A0ABU3XE00_9BACI|nr:hypothetical protein [Alkalihalophilus lindianensis]MDV2686106.1 hypothetical protein [Alkalihalophilus lindianensis]
MKKSTLIVSLVILVTLTLVGLIIVRTMSGDATALNDSFTKEFIAEEWVEDEFHLFESKTGQYRMLFPDQFQMISKPPEFYGRQGDYYEHWAAQIFSDSKDGISYYLTLRFRENEVDHFKTDLNRMLDDHSFQGQYEEIKLNNKIIFFGSSHWAARETRGVINSPNKNDANTFFGLIRDQHSNRTIKLVYTTICYKEELGCEFNSEQHFSFALKLMKSVEFLDKQ